MVYHVLKNTTGTTLKTVTNEKLHESRWSQDLQRDKISRLNRSEDIWSVSQLNRVNIDLTLLTNALEHNFPIYKLSEINFSILNTYNYVHVVYFFFRLHIHPYHPPTYCLLFSTYCKLSTYYLLSMPHPTLCFLSPDFICFTHTMTLQRCVCRFRVMLVFTYPTLPTLLPLRMFLYFWKANARVSRKYSIMV